MSSKRRERADSEDNRWKLIIPGLRGRSFASRYSPRDRRAIGIAVMALGAFSFFLTARLVCLNRQFDGQTIRVMGSVEAIYPSTPRFPFKYNPNIAYRYPVGAAEIYIVAPVSEEVFDGFRVGDPLPIKYLLGSPTVSRIDLPALNAQRRQAVYGMTSLAILFACAGAYIFRNACRDHRS